MGKKIKIKSCSGMAGFLGGVFDEIVLVAGLCVFIYTY